MLGIGQPVPAWCERVRMNLRPIMPKPVPIRQWGLPLIMAAENGCAALTNQQEGGIVSRLEIRQINSIL